eukprot:g2214.t1
MSRSTATPTSSLELTLDEHDVDAEQRTPPCATPKGYRAIPVDITLTTWKADLTKCSVCDVRFTWLNHRHKCRKCMEAVCNSCSKARKVLRAYTAPKRVCDRCIKNCWTPRDTPTTPRKLTDADADPATKAAPGKDGRRVSLTVSAPDANACAVVATATAPLSPGTPAAAGFFGPGCVTTPSATTTPAPPASTTVGGGGARDTDNSPATTITTTIAGGVDTRPQPSSSGHRRRHHRRQVSVAMLSSPATSASASASPSPPLSSPATSASASASPSPVAVAMTMMPPPPTPAAAIGEEVDEDDAMLRPPSAAASPSSSSASPAPFFGGRPGAVRRRNRRESSGGRLESRVWGGGHALGGGGDVDRAVAELLQLQQAQNKADTETGTEGQEEEAALSASVTAALPPLPEEPAAPATTGAGGVVAAAAINAVEQEKEVGEDCGEGGPMMIKITACSGLAMSGVAIGTGVAVAVLLRSAFSLVFFY